MSKHLKRLAAPKVLRIPRKVHKWTVKPAPGPHPADRCIPLLILVRDMLGYADTGKEAKRIIGAREIYVDHRVVRDHKFPVGFMDVVSIPKVNEHYRILLDRLQRLRPIPIDEEHSKWKLVRIENKTVVKGGKIQLNLHDGRNILLDKNAYKTGDVLKIELPSQKIIDVFELKKGNMAMIIGGKHAGTIATIERYEVLRSPKPNVVWFKEGFSTTKNNVFVVGTKKPEITVPEVKAV